MGLRLYQVDSFTDAPFAGNPAAVAILEDFVSDVSMQAVATEMNLSETAFVRAARADAFDLRWFTPGAEVDLCGHATLAAAHVLWEQGIVDAADRIRFDTLSGRLEAWQVDGVITMDFPSEPAEMGLSVESLGGAVPPGVVAVGRNRLDYMVVLESETAVRDLRPNLEGIARLGSRGMMVTAPSDVEEYDFVSRYFAPQFGVPEDPVTGSAHCCLGPYWAGRLGRRRLTGYQASRRGGKVHVEVRDERVWLGGRAVSTATIELLVELR